MKNDQTEDVILGLALAGWIGLLLIPFLIFKSVEQDPSFFEGLRVKDTAKTMSVMMGVAGILSLTLWFFPKIGQFSLVHIHHFNFQSRILILWVIGNLTLGSLTYGAIPYWRGVLRQKNQFKGQFY